ncbi:ABC transporter permease [Bacillus sp. MUM 13]|uniref:ABC transporter permease n=1 Tax=Bacillus sp. MUM 13 TaxID=1678001 RepID=UPI0008F586F5|nr:ABC transporter permease [Bacillus sp. MUM 13]OIK09975.1 macrolide ABC transporter permease [Bacillus sp. MUM 13]
MNFLDSIKIAFSSIISHKMRSILTMLGIIIGVGSIITIVAIGQGGSMLLKSQFAGSGNNTLEIDFQPDENNLPTTSPTDSLTFTQEDLFQLKHIPDISHVIPTNTSLEPLSNNEKRVSTNIKGITKDYLYVNSIRMVSGKKFSDYDFSQSNNVVLINQKSEKEFFKSSKSIGKIIEIRGQPFQIIGIYKTNAIFGVEAPEMLIPLSVWGTTFGTDNIQSLTIQVKDINKMEQTGNEAVDMLNKLKSPDLKGKYQIFNLAALQKGLTKVTDIMTIIIAGVASISLLVGGIGVMNIMLVSVTERTREIGIRKALGASRGKILLQFLIEAMMLTLIGGVIGIALGVGGAFVVSSFAHWPALISLKVVVGGVLFSMGLGIIFGLIPANRAAKLEPIEALRYE